MNVPGLTQESIAYAEMLLLRTFREDLSVRHAAQRELTDFLLANAAALLNIAAVALEANVAPMRERSAWPKMPDEMKSYVPWSSMGAE